MTEGRIGELRNIRQRKKEKMHETFEQEEALEDYLIVMFVFLALVFEGPHL
jgi:hypothetical protein